MAESTEAPDGDGLICPACGYDLRGPIGDRCPECGLTIDRTQLAQSRLPWTHRARIGRGRAYWRTNWLVLRQAKVLASEIDRPVDFRAAQTFRRMTVLFAFIPLLGLGIWFYVRSLDRSLWQGFPTIVARAPALPGPSGTALGWVLEVCCLAAMAVALWLFLLGAAGVASYFYHPRRLPVVRQNRAVALSYYTCAPVAWLFVPALLVTGGLVIFATPLGEHTRGRLLSAGLLLLAGVTGGSTIIAWWYLPVRLLRPLTGCGWRRAIALALFLPPAWTALAALAALIPLTVVFLSLVILSLG